MEPIVFIADTSEGTERQREWLALLNELMPGELILKPEELSDQQAAELEIAIVENPDPKALTRYPKLRWVQSVWAGVEGLASQLPLEHIKLVRLIDPQLTKTMAEAVLAWTLYLHRRMPEYARLQEKGQWQQLVCPSAEELRVSVLGAGTLGMAAANALHQHGYRVCCWSRTAKDVSGFESSHGQKVWRLCCQKQIFW